MKPNLYIFACITALLFFTGCHDTIFYDINQEVELYSAQVTGDVNSMARFSDYLVTQNGYPWYKSASSTTNGEWSKMAAIPDDGTVWKVATDEKYIYAISRVYTEDTNSSSDYEGELIQKSSKVYYTDSVDGSWEEVDTSTNYSAYYPVTIFCTDSTEAKNRFAYVRMSDGSVHKLNGSTSLSSSTVVSTTATNVAALTTEAPVAAAYCGGTVYFSDYPALASDGTTLYWAKTSDTITVHQQLQQVLVMWTAQIFCLSRLLQIIFCSVQRLVHTVLLGILITPLQATQLLVLAQMRVVC